KRTRGRRGRSQAQSKVRALALRLCPTPFSPPRLIQQRVAYAKGDNIANSREMRCLWPGLVGQALPLAGSRYCWQAGMLALQITACPTDYKSKPIRYGQ